MLRRAVLPGFEHVGVRAPSGVCLYARHNGHLSGHDGCACGECTAHLAHCMPVVYVLCLQRMPLACALCVLCMPVVRVSRTLCRPTICMLHR